LGFENRGCNFKKSQDDGTWHARITGIKNLIDITITKDDVQLAKPDPEPLLTAVKLLGVEVQETVYIGDSCFDIQASKAAGITAIGVTWGAAKKEELMTFLPDYLVESWIDLKYCLESIKNQK